MLQTNRQTDRQTDRQTGQDRTDRQRSGSIGRTILQTVAQLLHVKMDELRTPILTYIALSNILLNIYVD